MLYQRRVYHHREVFDITMSGERMAQPLDAGHDLWPWALARDVAPKGRREPVPGSEGTHREWLDTSNKMSTPTGGDSTVTDGFGMCQMLCERTVRQRCEGNP